MLGKNIGDVRVCAFLGVSILVIFLLYATSIIKSVPCSNDTVSLFISNFIHTDISHFLANMYGLYAMARIEEEIGSKQFIKLVVFLLVCNTIGELIIHKIDRSIPCAIGFSGVLFGLLAWDVFTYHGIDVTTLTAVAFAVALPSFTSKKASLSGHAVGAVSGIIGAYIYSST